MIDIEVFFLVPDFPVISGLNIETVVVVIIFHIFRIIIDHIPSFYSHSFSSSYYFSFYYDLNYSYSFIFFSIQFIILFLSPLLLLRFLLSLQPCQRFSITAATIITLLKSLCLFCFFALVLHIVCVSFLRVLQFSPVTHTFVFLFLFIIYSFFFV